MVSGWNQGSEIGSPEWALDVSCAVCGSDQVSCYVCQKFPEFCDCPMTEKFSAIWCIECDDLVDPAGEDVWAREPQIDSGPNWNDNYEDDSMSKKKGKGNKKRKKDKQKKQKKQKQSTAPKKVSSNGKYTSKKDDDLYKYVGKKTQSYYDNLGGYAWGMCGRHYGAEVDMNGLIVHASSSWNDRKRNEFVPDWGLYADWCWKPSWRAEHIDWPDMSIPRNKIMAFEQILVAVEKIQQGLKVEVGCIGGHGRTGTILAVMGVIMGMTADDAIDHVRDTYCTSAIETHSQEWYVEWVEAQLLGKEAPPEPYSYYSTKTAKTTPKSTYKGGTTTGGSADSKGTCSQADHWEMFLDGKNKCTKYGNACKWFVQDMEKIQEEGPPKNLNSQPKSTSYSSTAVVRGYRVPKPGHKEPGHHPEAKKGCKCDVCRYLARGHGALMEPVTKEAANAWKNERDRQDRLVAERFRERKAQTEKAEEPKNEQRSIFDDLTEGRSEPTTHSIPNNHIVMTCMPGGKEVIETHVSDTFEPMPPDEHGMVHGQIIAGYVWHDEFGWIWQGLAEADLDNLALT